MDKKQKKMRLACIATMCLLNMTFGLIAGLPLLLASGSLGMCYTLARTVEPATPPAISHLNLG